MSATLLPAPADLHLAELAEANRPTQLPLLTRTAELLAGSKAVTHLLVRGSLASGTADRLSDVDFVVGIRDAALPAFATALDDLMTIEAGALLPGWRDTIVGDLGGLGFVFLAPHDGRLHQIDLYLAPASPPSAGAWPPPRCWTATPRSRPRRRRTGSGTSSPSTPPGPAPAPSWS